MWQRYSQRSLTCAVISFIAIASSVLVTTPGATADQIVATSTATTQISPLPATTSGSTGAPTLRPYPDTSTVNLTDTTPHGPSNHILGIDIARYQHNGSAPLDFSQAYKVGARFVYINGGNSLADADKIAANYYLADRLAAQNAGLYTGLYYYLHFPNTKSQTTLLTNADNQAHKILDRIATQGGIAALDLPIALDVETLCTEKIIFGICAHSISSSLAHQWVDRWLDDITTATGKKPVIYSYLNFFSTVFPTASEFVQYPLWVATAGIDPQTHKNGPVTSNSCRANPWMSSGCQLNWSIWQYSSGALGRTFGMPGGNIDLDILNTPLELNAFATQ